MPKPSRIIVASIDFLPLLLESLLEWLRSSAEAVENCGFDVDAYPQALARLDRIRALLDATGWGEHGDIDLSEHSEALRDALADRLATERDMQASAKEDTDAKGGQRASEYAGQIEAFMREAGLDVPGGSPIGDLREILLQSLLYSLMTTAVEFDVLDMEPRAFRAQVDKFEAIRAVLDSIEWGARDEIDVQAHYGVLQQVLTHRLSAEDGLMAEPGDAAREQRERADACARTIEIWAESVGLELAARNA